MKKNKKNNRLRAILRESINHVLQEEYQTAQKVDYSSWKNNQANSYGMNPYANMGNNMQMFGPAQQQYQPYNGYGYGYGYNQDDEWNHMLQMQMLQQMSQNANPNALTPMQLWQLQMAGIDPKQLDWYMKNAGQQQAYNPMEVMQLMNMGFTQEQAINYLTRLQSPATPNPTK